ncbi:MAG: ATP-grasp domain-containing protein [Halarcobacter sp.]
MQILFLTDQNINEKYSKVILQYNKALTQNILLVNYSSLYEKQKFIYAKECMVLNKEEVLTDVLLSPSIVIDLSQTLEYTILEKYLKTCWVNVQQAFFQKDEAKQNSIGSIESSAKVSNCICYTNNNEAPILKVIEDSINLSSDNKILSPFNTIGLIEQAITEFFADINYFSQFEWPRNKDISNHQSTVFFVQFEVFERFGDFIVENIQYQSLNYEQLISYNNHFLFKYIDDLLDFRLDRYIQQVKFRTHIIKLCEKYKIDLEPSYYKTFVLTKDNHIGLQRRYYGSLNSKRGINIINDKHKTNTFLRENGFNANLSYEYTLKQLLEEEVIDNLPIDYPLTLKPTDKKEGYGVVTNIPNKKRMKISIKKMLNLEDINSVLIEEFFEGVTYRVLVVSGEVTAVLKYIPASILGDGESSIEELIKNKNLISKSRVRINNALRLSIFNDEKRWETVLPEGKKYIISHNSHASNGGQSINVTNLFDEKYKKVCSQACKSLGLKMAGIDMIVNSAGDYRIIEINCGPALATHVNPKHGSSIKTYTKVLYSLLEEVDIEKDENSYLKDLVPYHK